MPRRSKNTALKKTQEKEKEKKMSSTSEKPLEDNLVDDIPSEDSPPKTGSSTILFSSTDASSPLEIGENERAVEVIHWIPASTGSVIQVPNGSDHYNFELDQDGQVVEVPVFQSETVYLNHFDSSRISLIVIC